MTIINIHYVICILIFIILFRLIKNYKNSNICKNRKYIKKIKKYVKFSDPLVQSIHIY
jgi:hypothetical protein